MDEAQRCGRAERDVVAQTRPAMSLDCARDPENRRSGLNVNYARAAVPIARAVVWYTQSTWLVPQLLRSVGFTTSFKVPLS